MMVGDVVRVKDCAPKMTIQKLTNETAECVWFWNGRVQFGVFEVANLDPAED